jgi:hypothetical protein
MTYNNRQKNKVINIPRGLAKRYGGQLPTYFPYSGDVIENVVKNPIWISVNEPDCIDDPTYNPRLEDSCLKLFFWDIVKETPYNDEILLPPSMEDAIKIVDFILANPDRDILTNCAAGISRSGAICKFCEDFLGYDWVQAFKNRAFPNMLLYRMMAEYYTDVLGGEYAENVIYRKSDIIGG